MSAKIREQTLLISRTYLVNISRFKIFYYLLLSVILNSNI